MHAIGQAAIPAALILLLVYRRIRRTVGFQTYHPHKLKTRIGIFTAVGILLIGVGALHPISWAADAAGAALGGALAWFAVRHLEFERRETGWFYRTHTGVQSVVVGLIAARIAYRFIYLIQMQNTAGNSEQMQTFSRDPWTSGTVFIMIVFYIGYYLFVLRKGKELPAA